MNDDDTITPWLCKKTDPCSICAKNFATKRCKTQIHQAETFSGEIHGFSLEWGKKGRVTGKICRFKQNHFVWSIPVVNAMQWTFYEKLGEESLVSLGYHLVFPWCRIVDRKGAGTSIESQMDGLQEWIISTKQSSTPTHFVEITSCTQVLIWQKLTLKECGGIPTFIWIQASLMWISFHQGAFWLQWVRLGFSCIQTQKLESRCPGRLLAVMTLLNELVTWEAGRASQACIQVVPFFTKSWSPLFPPPEGCNACVFARCFSSKFAPFAWNPLSGFHKSSPWGKFNPAIHSKWKFVGF